MQVTSLPCGGLSWASHCSSCNCTIEHSCLNTVSCIYCWILFVCFQIISPILLSSFWNLNLSSTLKTVLFSFKISTNCLQIFCLQNIFIALMEIFNRWNEAQAPEIFHLVWLLFNNKKHSTHHKISSYYCFCIPILVISGWSRFPSLLCICHETLAVVKI